MLARISVPEDYSATQSLRLTNLASIISEQIAEREAQKGSSTATAITIYESVIGHCSNFGDSIIGGEDWWKPTWATVGDLKLIVKLPRTPSNADFPGAQCSELLANNVTTPEWNPAIDAAISEIEEFRSRKNGWKGPNSLGPTERTIDDAKAFASVVLADTKIEPPHIGLAADGEISFFWQNPKIMIDLTIAGDSTYAYFAKPGAGEPFFEDAAPVTQNLPEEILCLIRRAE